MNDITAEGQLIDETTNTDRAQKFTEIEIDDVKIDFYDAHNKVVHKVKKSANVKQAHIAQVQYICTSEYPKLKQRKTVAALTDKDIENIARWEGETN